GLAGCVVVVWCVVLLNAGAFSAFAAGVAVVFWLCLVSVFLLLEWAVLALLGMGAPPLPGPLSSWSGSGWLMGGMIALLLVTTLLREGLLAPSFVLSLNWYSSSNHRNTQSNTQGSTNGFNGDVARMRGSYLECEVFCDDGTVCRAFKHHLACDNARGPNTEGLPVTSATIRLNHGGDPFCYTPLFKSTTLQAHVNADLSTAQGSASSHQSLSMTTQLDYTMTGIGSCHTFNSKLGALLAREVAGGLNDVIQGN
ncbi:MAG: hypothetical protein AAFS10_24735, partial [Myxococcota bacterium]